MKNFLDLPATVRAYVTGVVSVGALTLALSVHSLYTAPIGGEWLLLAALTVLTGSFSVKVPSINAYISVSEAFVFASVLLFGAEAGTVTVLLECLVILVWMPPQGRPVYRMLFNLAAPSVAIWVAGSGFYWLSGIAPYSQTFTPLPLLFVPLLAFTAAYFLLNSWLVAVAVGLETQRSPATIWWKNFAWLSVNYFSGASLAALIVTYTQRLDFSTLAVIVPLLVVSYLTFRTAMGRAEDSYNHLSELNKLYLSTIETLAMAIDAKDQITHGHIRRVQIYAVGLAKRLGVSDERLLKAIEAAALLHDMGKLAVPEHILNKPGKLTAAEFEKMKLHASVGADILSAIEFPYPVVPIVRHHHENWDGTGYPSGISGTDIPIGARILSVVDCFDALTSDRPYRARLSDDDALDILRARRGSMYDPLVVDTFVKVHKEIAPEPDEQLQISSSALAEITTSTLNQTTSAGAAGLHEQFSTALLSDLQEPGAPVDSVIERIGRELAPFRLAIVFRHDRASDSLLVHSCYGEKSGPLESFKIPLGERLSGWVAANRSPVLNSDPVLDLGETARHLGLTHTLSVPVVQGTELVAVLSFYGDCAYTEPQGSLLQAAATLLSPRFGTAQSTSTHSSEAARPSPAAPVSAMVCIQVINWVEVVEGAGSGSEQIAAAIAVGLKALLSDRGVLLRHREDEFVCIFGRAEAKDIRDFAKAVRAKLAAVQTSPVAGSRLELAVDTLFAPVDSESMWEILVDRDSAESSRPPIRRPLVH